MESQPAVSAAPRLLCVQNWHALRAEVHVLHVPIPVRCAQARAEGWAKSGIVSMLNEGLITVPAAAWCACMSMRVGKA